MQFTYVRRNNFLIKFKLQFLYYVIKNNIKQHKND